MSSMDAENSSDDEDESGDEDDDEPLSQWELVKLPIIAGLVSSLWAPVAAISMTTGE